jgi:DUF4097 and DUF4098 domain-containing protein YvlB
MKLLLIFSLLVGFLFVSKITPVTFGDINEQINKTVTLAPGSDVRISGINGPVIVDTWEGDKAEIKITIKASDREALERRPLVVEDTPNSLVIRTINEREDGKWKSDRGWVRHDVFVRLPRKVNLKVSGVNGSVQVAEITGAIGVKGINGKVEVRHAGTASEIGGINGQTSISIAQLGQDGLRVSGINGQVEIGLPANVNADVDVNGVNGKVSSDLPLAVAGELRRGQLKGTLGGGGSRIAVSGINGGVHLKQN